MVRVAASLPVIRVCTSVSDEQRNRAEAQSGSTRVRSRISSSAITLAALRGFPRAPGCLGASLLSSAVGLHCLGLPSPLMPRFRKAPGVRVLSHRYCCGDATRPAYAGLSSLLRFRARTLPTLSSSLTDTEQNSLPALERVKRASTQGGARAGVKRTSLVRNDPLARSPSRRY